MMVTIVEGSVGAMARSSHDSIRTSRTSQSPKSEAANMWVAWAEDSRSLPLAFDALLIAAMRDYFA